ncbi:MAG TPA: FHA domain-containing protein [Myxococcales bacterium]
MNRAASTCKPPPFLAAADDTIVHRAGNLPPGTPRLLVTAGPGKGAELALGHGVATLGRGAENALVIADISVSRRHARIEQRAAAWVVIDEGSGNGTRVNGTPVRERRLRDGDEIAVGATRVRFLEAGGVAARDLPPRKPGRPRQLRAQALLGAVAAGAILAAGAGVHRSRQVESQAPEPAMRGQAQPAPPQHVALAGAGPRQEDAAARLAAQPASRPADPPSAEPAQTAPRPSRPAPTARPSSPQRSPAPTWAKLVPSSDKSDAAAEALAIVAAYRRGDLATARERAKEGRSAEAARLSAALADFDRACGKAAAQPTPADAVRSLEEAAAADRAIAGSGQSRPGEEVRKALSAQHLLAAASLDSDEQLPQSAAHLRAAAQADPSSQPARDALRRLQERVHRIYLRGYVARETEPAEARRCLGLVAQALPASDETAQKAKRWLDKLEGKAAE